MKMEVYHNYSCGQVKMEVFKCDDNVMTSAAHMEREGEGGGTWFLFYNNTKRAQLHEHAETIGGLKSLHFKTMLTEDQVTKVLSLIHFKKIHVCTCLKLTGIFLINGPPLLTLKS